MENLSRSSRLNLERILADEDIFNSFLFNDKKPGTRSLKDDGSFVIGATCFEWWNHFIGCEKKLSFHDSVVHLINFMAGNGKNRNDFALDGLYQDFVNFTLKQDDKNRMVDILLTAYLYGYKEIQKEGKVPSEQTILAAVTKQVRNPDGVAVLTANGPVFLGKDLKFYEIE